MALKNNIPLNKVVNIGLPGTEEQYEQLINATDKESIILGVGNMGVGGADLAKFFENKHKD